MHEHDQVFCLSQDNNPGVSKISQHQDFRYPGYSPDLMDLAEIPSQPPEKCPQPFCTSAPTPIDARKAKLGDEEQPCTPLRKRKPSYSHGGKRTRRFQESIIPQQNLDNSHIFVCDCISYSRDGMDPEPITLPAAEEPTQALRQLNIDYSTHHYNIAEESEVSDTITNTSGRSTISPDRAPSSISTYSSTSASRTHPCSPNQSLSNDLATGLEECANFSVHCDLLGFMNRHYGGMTPLHTLGSVISLSGTAHQAQATTAEQYINQYWPSTGPMLLEALQSAINSEDHRYQGTCSCSCLDLMPTWFYCWQTMSKIEKHFSNHVYVNQFQKVM